LSTPRFGNFGTATKVLPQPWMEAVGAGKGSAMSRHGPSMPMGQGSWRLPRCCWASNWRSRTPKCLSSFVSYTGRRACCASNRRQAGRQNDIAVAPAPRHTVGHEAALPETTDQGSQEACWAEAGACRPLSSAFGADRPSQEASGRVFVPIAADGFGVVGMYVPGHRKTSRKCRRSLLNKSTKTGSGWTPGTPENEGISTLGPLSQLCGPI